MAGEAHQTRGTCVVEKWATVVGFEAILVPGSWPSILLCWPAPRPTRRATAKVVADLSVEAGSLCDYYFSYVLTDVRQ